MTTPDVTVVIVSWNTRELLARCLDSIADGAAGLGVETIVVDNASEDGSVEYLRSAQPGVMCIANDDNRGFAAAVNQGCMRAQGRAILILNPDIVLHRGTLRKLLDGLTGRPRAGAVMPALVGPDGRRQSGYVRRLPGLMQVLLFSTGLGTLSRRLPALVRRYLEAPIPEGGAALEVDQIPGACMLVRREVVRTVGGMDEGYLLFFEDVDWSRRIRSAGWELYLHPEITATHEGGASVGRVRREMLAARFGLSMLRYFRIHTPLPTYLLATIILAGNALLMIPLRALQRVLGMDAARSAASVRDHAAFLGSLWRKLVYGRDLPLAALTLRAGGGDA